MRNRAWSVYKSVWLATALLAAISSAAQAQDDAERQKLYRWFDSLSLSDLMKKPFGEIHVSQAAFESRIVEPTLFGFLERGGGEQFSALTLSLAAFNTIGNQTNAANQSVSTFTRADFKSWLRVQKELLIESDEKPSGWPQPGSRRPFSLGYGEPGDSFIVSRVADLRGFSDLANWFYARSEKNWFAGAQPEGNTFGERLKNDLARGFLQRAIGDFEDLSLSRADLLERMNYVVNHFPPSTARTQAESLSVILTRMVKEDSVHKPVDIYEFDTLSDAAKARECVWQLRNQPASKASETGYEEISWELPGRISPFRTLGFMGVAAVPTLIDALSDKTLTRKVIHGSNGEQQRILQVRDDALQILNRIASKIFAAEDVYLADDAAVAKVKASVEAWWQKLKLEGEERLLIEEVSAGGVDSDLQAERLALDFPDRTFDAIREGIKNSKESATRSKLIIALQSHWRWDKPAFWKDEMKNGATLELRLRAAEVVQQYRKNNAAEAMAVEWLRINDEPVLLGELRTFLVSSWTPVAMQALTKDLKSQSVSRRAAFVTAMFERSPFGIPKPWLRSAEVRATLRMAEDALAGELADQERDPGMAGRYNGFGIEDPPIRLLAAYALAHLWPEKYQFDTITDFKMLDKLCRHDLNVWRISVGLSPLAQK